MWFFRAARWIDIFVLVLLLIMAAGLIGTVLTALWWRS